MVSFAKEIYLARHGETSWNKLGLAQGSKNDIELNDNGINQSTQLGKYLRDNRINGQNFDLILCSPLKRAKKTAQIIADLIGYDQQNIIQMNELTETDMGLLAIGKTQKELMTDPFYKQFFELMDEYNKLDHIKQLELKSDIPEIFNTKYKMESIDSVTERVNKIIQFIKLTKNKKILVITHADTIRTMNKIILNSVSEIKGDLSNGKNCHLTYYKIEDGRFKLILPPSTFYLKQKI